LGYRARETIREAAGEAAMTTRVGNIVILEAEPDATCELCGAVEETRPYGPDGKRICHPCGQKPENRPHVERALRRLFQSEPDST
jgi:hypothetical protein